MVVCAPYSSRACTMSTTRVLRTSGQFSLKVMPSTRTLAPLTVIFFLSMSLMVSSTTN